MCDLEGHLYPAFPKARYFVQRGEWDDALNGHATMTTTYREENYVPLKTGGLMTLLEGDQEVYPGIRTQITGGHTRYHQMVQIESGGETVVYAGDILPMITHIRAPYNMAYDLYPHETMVQKMRLLEQAARNRWILIWDHDPSISIGRVVDEGNGKYRVEPVG